MAAVLSFEKGLLATVTALVAGNDLGNLRDGPADVIMDDFFPLEGRPAFTGVTNEDDNLG